METGQLDLTREGPQLPQISVSNRDTAGVLKVQVLPPQDRVQLSNGALSEGAAYD